jgi:uncharacterized membrane-anchored protein YhcB (DUF1043 family)
MFNPTQIGLYAFLALVVGILIGAYLEKQNKKDGK